MFSWEHLDWEEMLITTEGKKKKSYESHTQWCD